MKCLRPALSAIPDGEWFCDNCATDIGGPIFGALHDEKQYIAEPIKGKNASKRKASDSASKNVGEWDWK
jgi:hypothetical protein